MGISGVSRCHVEPAQETALLLSSSSPFACLKGEAWVVLGSLATSAAGNTKAAESHRH